MASIGGLSSSTSNNLGSLKGFGGLVSGLDRDSLIEAMTSGTQSKIQKQKQKKQTITWQQEAIRNITDKMYEFSQKYMSYTSSSNLTSSSFFAKSQITSVGANAKYVSVTGNSSLIDQISVAGVKQLAKNAQASSSSAVSDGTLTANIKLGKTQASTLLGESFSVKIGGTTYDVTLPANSDVTYGVSSDGSLDIDQTIKDLNEALKNTQAGDSNLSELMEFVKTDDNKITIKNKKTSGDSLYLTSGESFFRKVGILKEEEKLPTSGIGENQQFIPQGTANLVETKQVSDMLAKTTLTFSYNGETKQIKLDDNVNINSVEDYANALQKQLNKAFGTGRIEVKSNSNGEVTFTTKDPATGDIDKTSVLAITASSGYGILGENGILGIKAGQSNRMNLTNTAEQEFASLFSEGAETAKIVINGEDIIISKDQTVQEVMDTINKSNAGVKMEYVSSLDKFVITSTENGASGKIVIGKDAQDKVSQNFLYELGFAEKTEEGKPTVEAGAVLSQGEDAIISIKYKDSNETVEISRGTNSFKLDKLNISVTGKFGEYDNSGKLVEGSTEAVTFDAKADTDKVTTAVKEMIEGFNAIIEAVNSQVSTKQSSGEKYEPLTDQQREEMAEDQIKKWEEKAKVGILYNDSELRSLMDSLRFVLPTGADRQALADIGISVSSNYSDNGKLTFDEEKFKEAMKSDPEKVQKLFTQTKQTDEKGNVISQSGVMVNIKTVMDKYASMTGARKGILVERAGSTKAPTTVLKNSLQTQLDQITDIIKRLQTTLKNEQNRYINQFTQLETAISKMNAQSSWLSQG